MGVRDDPPSSHTDQCQSIIFLAIGSQKLKQKSTHTHTHSQKMLMEALKFRDLQQLIYFLGKYIIFSQGFISISYKVVVSNIFCFSPRKLGKMNPFWRAYFSDGLVQPPTSLTIRPGSQCCLRREDGLTESGLKMRFGNLFSPILRQQ